MKKVHLVMPMAGKGSRFVEQGFGFPKPLIEINGKPFFYWSAMSILKFIEVADLTFVVLQEHVDKYNMQAELYRYFPDAKVQIIPEVLNGAVLTCMEGVKEIEDFNPIIFNDCDHMFRCKKFEEFIANDVEIDGGLLTFWSDEAKYSFLMFDKNDNVIETVEKKVISNAAICGCYYFANKKLFLDAANIYLTECKYREYFVSGVYNVMARNGSLIKAFQTDFHLPFGVPEEYEFAKNSKLFKELG